VVQRPDSALNPLNVVMLGPPGAGKGTQSERFARTHGLPKIATGDILREAVKVGTAMGQAAAAAMDAGKLVGDEVMIGIVGDRLDQPDTSTGFVLDGFPRTVAQARALDEIMRERNNGPLIVVDVMVPPEELVRRLATRRICVDCGANADPQATDRCRTCGGRLEQRADDNQDVVRERLTVYARETKPVLEFYRERSTFRVVNGAQAPDRVAQELDTMIDDAAAARA
jgi:adenylate kinase